MRKKELDIQVDSRELAKHFNVTRLTTINWRKKGCPCKFVHAEDSVGENYRVIFNLVDVIEWLEDYRDGIVPGPKRKKKVRE